MPRHLVPPLLVEIRRRLFHFLTALFHVLGSILRPIPQILRSLTRLIGQKGTRFLARSRSPQDSGRYANAKSQ
jgi:hypothetical protein